MTGSGSPKVFSTGFERAMAAKHHPPGAREPPRRSRYSGPSCPPAPVFVANFRPHEGQANRNMGVGSVETPASTVSFGAETVEVVPHPAQATFCPIRDHSTSFDRPQERQGIGNVIMDPAYHGVKEYTRRGFRSG